MTDTITLPREKKLEIAKTASEWYFHSKKTNLHETLKEMISAAINLTIDAMAQQSHPNAGWVTAADEEMIGAHIGVANMSDSYESAKSKLKLLIDWHIAVATDPAVNGGLSLQPVAQQAEPYDQQSLDLCKECGWKTLIPGDGCLNCERGKIVAQQAEQVPVSTVNFLPHDDHLRFVQRVLESDAPKSDRNDAAQMVRDIRRSLFIAAAPKGGA